jgi:hypothetical protein
MRAFSIVADLDPDGVMPRDVDPRNEYLTYRDDVAVGTGDDMGFTLMDFREYITGLRKPT